MSQLLDLTQAQFVAAQCLDELVDLLRAHTVHAHERAHDIHVGVNGKVAAEELFADRLAHLGQQTQAHAHPGFAAGEAFGDFAQGHPAHLFQLGEEPSLLENGQGFVVGDAQQVEDGGDCCEVSLIRRNIVIGADIRQQFIIYGKNFDGEASVTLRNLDIGQEFPNRRIVGEPKPDRITINPIFSTDPATWSVQVINGDGQFRVFLWNNH